MTALQILHLASALSVVVYDAYITAGLALRTFGLRKPIFEWTWLLTKWPALAGIWLMWLSDILTPGGNKTVSSLLTVVNLCCWWFWRNAGDDDFRRKLKDRARGVVQSIGHRLVVIIPVPQPA